MPNHCSNYLTVVGDKDELSKFVKSITTVSEEDGESVRILKNLYPCPAELYEATADFGKTKRTDLIEKYGANDWYDWCITHWGTKWGDYDTILQSEFTEGDTSVDLTFTTAWGPAVNGLVKVSEQFPNLAFVNSFEEGGMCFVGAVSIINGTIVHESEGEYPNIDTDDDGDCDWDVVMDNVQDVMDTCIGHCVLELPENFKKLFNATV
mgnify:FL=1